jgi:DNA invertase Pin-like site-specific DNA recombinase
MSEQPLVAYYRVSTRQQKASGLGLEAQRYSVRAYIKSCPGKLIAELTEIESGRKSDRPIIKEALWYCRVFGAKLVIARLDRLARSVALIANLMESGIDFVAADMPMANRFTIHILAAVAEYEAQLVSERTKAAFAAAKARGKAFHNQNHHSKLSPAAFEAAIRVRRERSVARALEYAPLLCVLRDRGESIAGIAAQLDLMGIEPPRNCRRWYPRTIGRLFRIAGERPPKSRRGYRPDQRGMQTAPLLPLPAGSLNGAKSGFVRDAATHTTSCGSCGA